jgi:iron complex outermembrane receptor protein
MALAQNNDAAHQHDRLHGEDHDHRVLEEVIVTGVPIRRDANELAQSATVLRGEQLAREVANNIGDTLSRQPGLANASFGQNVGRPVIRGQQGARVGVLADNMSSADASAVSQDHAVPIEPFLADQIEVLRGPSTLLYGSGAIGGVVNIVTHTIPEQVPETGFEGRALLQGDTAADQRMGAARLDFGSGSWAGHASGFYRRSDDYEIPGAAELYPDHDEEEHGDEHEHEEEMSGVLENSFLDNEGASLGGSWIGERWRAGLSYTWYDSNYGIPGAHSHAHGDEHDEEEHDEDHDEHEHEEEEENVTIGLESRRLDMELEGQDPLPGFTRLKLNLADTRYEHTEFEGLETGTMFSNDTVDSRLELSHVPIGVFKGALGAQYTDRDFSALGDEAFVPPSTTETLALFLVETAEVGDWRFDVGLRYEDIDVAADTVLAGRTARSFSPVSASASAMWHLDERSHLVFNLAHAERAPSDQELFAFGPHLATQTFEVGDADLGIESNLHMELAYRLHQGPVTGTISIYRDDFDDYIYLANTGLEEDGLPLGEWSQQNAEFTGGEIEVRWDLGHTGTGHWQLFGFYDRVRAELDNGENVPRIPTDRIGMGVDWDHDMWTGNVTWINASSHTRTAEFETATPGFDLLNAELTYLFDLSTRADLQLFVRAQNLLDEDVRYSASYLKDQAPQIGRNWIVGVRSYFQ